jgi:hypothetical protein
MTQDSRASSKPAEWSLGQASLPAPGAMPGRSWQRKE